MAYKREDNIRWFNNVMAIWTAFNGEMVSDEDIIWYPAIVPVKGIWNELIFGDQNFVAPSFYYEDPVIVYSEDRGETWGISDAPGHKVNTFDHISYEGNGKFVVSAQKKPDEISNTPYYGIFYSSDDGKTWMETETDLNGYNPKSFVSGGGASVCFASKGYSSNRVVKMIRSTDGGKTWEDSVYAVDPELAWNFTPSIAYGGGRFISVGRGKTAYSTDGGMTWANLSDILWSTPLSNDSVDNLLAYVGGTRFVYISGRFAFYNDGGDWIAASVPPDHDNSAVGVYGGDGILCPGKKEIIYYTHPYLYKSADKGDTWEFIQDIQPLKVQSISYGDGAFVLVGFGYGSELDALYLEEGSDLLKREKIPTQGWISGTQWTAVAYGRERFVALSYGGYDADEKGASDRAAYRDHTRTDHTGGV